MIGRQAAMAARVSRLLVDTCTLRVRSTGAVNAAGYPTETWTETAGVSCRYVTQRGAEQQPFTTQVPVGARSVYLPAGQKLATTDRITVTHLDGQALETPVALAIDGPPDILPSYTRVPVRLLTEA